MHSINTFFYWFSDQDFKDAASSNHPHGAFYDVISVLATHIIVVAVNTDLSK